MSKASKLYLKEIYQRFSYLAVWLPNTNLNLGDVGVQDADEFKMMTTLNNLGVPFVVRTSETPVDFTYTSHSGVTLKTKAEGEVAAGTMLPEAQAGISLQFGKEGAFLFQAVGCYVDEIEDKVTLGQAVIEMLKEGTWDSSWGVIDTLVRADSATIVVSNSQSAALELTAKAPVAVTNLANLEAGLSVNLQRGEIIRFIAAKGLAPLFRLSRVKQSLLSTLLGRSAPITFGGVSSEDSMEQLLEDGLFEAVAPM